MCLVYVVRVVDDVGDQWPSSVYECQSVVCVFTSHVSMESRVLAMCCMHNVVSISSIA